jgi:hypothetical protein
VDEVLARGLEKVALRHRGLKHLSSDLKLASVRTRKPAIPLGY